MRPSKFRFCSALILVLLAVGCANDRAEPSVDDHATASLSIAAKPVASTGIVTRTISPQLKPGCNYNTSCKLNCEWCSGNTCTCRLKGIP